MRRKAFEYLKLYVDSLGDQDILIADVPNVVTINNMHLTLKSKLETHHIMYSAP